MKISVLKGAKRNCRRLIRAVFASLPKAWRFQLYRRAMDCEPLPSQALELKIADSEAELEACFALLHDAYVASGFMRPDPSGLRVTPYHALPTTTTLCAKVDGKVVGTLSIVRDGVFGFPMQTAFDISAVRAKEGRIAEISALAIHPRYRKTGGSILFPLMKFMYEYCTRFFDTRHLLIAVNPNHIEMYESLLFFRRLTPGGIDRYDFANGAPAIGATLDLEEAPAVFEKAYAGKPGRRNLHRYFVDVKLPAIQFPSRPWHTSNDPIMTPALMAHFFARRTQAFDALDQRKKRLLHSIYPGPEWAGVLPQVDAAMPPGQGLREHPRFTLTCPASFRTGGHRDCAILGTLLELSATGFQAKTRCALPLGTPLTVEVELGQGVSSVVSARAVRQISAGPSFRFGCELMQSDEAWRRCVAWFEGATEPAPGAVRTPPKAIVRRALADV